MESALPLVTRLLNETGYAIGFSVEEGSCPIRSLGPHGRRLVNLSEILNTCRRRGSRSWLIKVLIDQKLTGMTLEPVNFFQYVQILFKFEINEGGKLIFIAEGIREKNIDIVLRLSWNIGFMLGRNIIWSRRKYVPIADSLRVFPMGMQHMRAHNMCGDAAVVPEAIVNSNRSPLRKEESPQTENDHSVKHTEVNPSKRKEKGLDLDNDTDALIRSKKVASPERKTTTTYTPLNGSKHDTFGTKISNSSQMEPLEREGNGATRI
ncbi:unnamed protein product [Fraxinus pennsylvanica]|uniref:Uncharacterized protein n=1 Tax=Fraxinus pennsylvanica TaxID=56036 RepID=A0AAD1ZS36_9LAMI|nr:unnamed protein product [Fraxinus pennsylvanica]